LSRALFALFAKAPIAGQVKTRMCPPLRPEEAAALYEAMLRDILEQSAEQPGVDRVLWFTPASERAWFEAAAPDHRLLAQEGPDLSARMRHLFSFHGKEDYTRMVLRGTDSPTLPQATVQAAFDALADCDLVLCPDRDGGYNLIGLREPCDTLFDVPMSTASVLERTLARAEELSLEVQLLAAHHDVDTADDLARLVLGARTPRTARWLADARVNMNR
jgi:rSAM/selenodomain-associated transferase 1